MKINIASDIHFEFYKSPTEAKLFLNQIIDDPRCEEVDVLVLAGDIVCLNNFPMVKAVFHKLCHAFKRVVYVPGNHEYYNFNFEDSVGVIEALEDEYKNLDVLDPATACYIEGHRFVGGTMWFPDTPFASQWHIKMQINDNHKIDKWYEKATQHNTEFRNFVGKFMEPGDVVVTHHLPSQQSISEDYKGSDLNCYYVSEMDDIIFEKQPAIWFHGHSHKPVNYQIGRTRVVSNPIGYYKYENDGVTPERFFKIVEI